VSRSAIVATGDGVEIAVWVVPGASTSRIQGIHGDKLKIRVSSPPEGGRANREVAAILEEALGRKPSLIRGMRGRSKVFEVTGTDVDTVCRKLGV